MMYFLNDIPIQQQATCEHAAKFNICEYIYARFHVETLVHLT